MTYIIRYVAGAILACAIVGFGLAPLYASASVEVFSRQDCSHCVDFFSFAETTLMPRGIGVVVHDIDTPEGRGLFDVITAEAKLSKVTPIIYIGGEFIVGFDSPETTGKTIEALLDRAQDAVYPTLANYSLGIGRIAERGSGCPEEACVEESAQTLVSIPFTHYTFSVAHYSLPALSFVLGLVDGFNPCAMWVLIMFATALIAIGNRRRMQQVITLFLLAEAIMYYAILSVWLYAWDFIGLDRIVTPVIGVLAIGTGLYFLYLFDRRNAACAIESPLRRARVSGRIKHIAEKPLTILTALGIIGIAFSVNIFEFACSIGIPQAFTKLLDIRGASWLVEQAMLGIYIIGYMVDDLIVFGLALYSFEKLGITTRYARMAHLVGGVLMLLLGLLMFFAPEVLAV